MVLNRPVHCDPGKAGKVLVSHLHCMQLQKSRVSQRMRNELATSQANSGEKNDAREHREAVIPHSEFMSTQCTTGSPNSAPGKVLTPPRGLFPFYFLALSQEKLLDSIQSANLHTHVRKPRLPNHSCSRHRASFLCSSALSVWKVPFCRTPRRRKV